MKNFALIIVLLFPLFSFCQKTNKLNITAKYISIYFKDNNGNASWNEIREMPAGDFKCQEQDSGKLVISFNRNEPQSEFINTTKEYKEEIQKIPHEICGFRFKGIYYESSEPADMAYAFYINPHKPNSLLMVKYIGVGQTIYGVNFYSDKKINPIQKANYKFDIK